MCNKRLAKAFANHLMSCSAERWGDSNKARVLIPFQKNRYVGLKKLGRMMGTRRIQIKCRSWAENDL